MQETPKVSIVLPVYNGERYLKQAIESILDQTIRDYELIIVDDCSCDNTNNMVSEYANQYSFINVVTNEINRGLPESLNIGFSVARGKYLMWTSDDNIMHKNALEEMLEVMEKNPNYGLVFSDMNLIDENGDLIGSRSVGDCNIYKGNCIGACFLYKCECKETIGDYDEKRRYVEDYDYWLRIAERYNIYGLHKTLYDYRYHDNSLTVKKIRQVGMQLADLRLKYINKIIDNVDKDTLRAIVFEMMVCGDNRVLDFVSDEIKESIQFISKRKKKLDQDKIFIFGAGGLGRSAINILHDKKIEGFIDNDSKKVGKTIEERKVISLNDYISNYREWGIVIATDLKYAYNIEKQLMDFGIMDAVLLYDMC